MDDLIRRQDVVNVLHEMFDDMLETDSWCERDLYNMIENIPSAQPERIGKWIPWKSYYGKDHKSWSDELKCSECGFKWGDEEYVFCPMCGTKMEGAEDEVN